MFLEVVPSFSSMVFRCGEGYVLKACRTSAAAAAAAAGPAAAITLFLPESRRDVKPRDSMFLEVVPSFRPWCFAVSQPPARTWLWSCFEGMGAAPAAPPAAAAGPAAAIALFLPESRRDVKPRDSMFLEVVPSFRAMVFCCFATAHSDFAVELF